MVTKFVGFASYYGPIIGINNLIDKSNIISNLSTSIWDI